MPGQRAGFLQAWQKTGGAVVSGDVGVDMRMGSALMGSDGWRR